MISSGTTALATNGAGNITALAANTTDSYLKMLSIDNQGTAPGFFSLDGGVTWASFPASQLTVVPIRELDNGLLLKRNGSTDLGSVYCWVV